MDFSGEAAEHKVIHDILEELIASINAAKEDHSKFKPAEMKELMEKFRGPLVRIFSCLTFTLSGIDNLVLTPRLRPMIQFHHLDAEVTNISAENLKAAGIDEAELAAMQKKLGEHAVGTSDPWTVVPFMRG